MGLKNAILGLALVMGCESKGDQPRSPQAVQECVNTALQGVDYTGKYGREISGLQKYYFEKITAECNEQ